MKSENVQEAAEPLTASEIDSAKFEIKEIKKIKKYESNIFYISNNRVVFILN